MMKSVLIISVMLCAICACHDTSDHNIHAPVMDTTGNAALNQPKDTSVHSGIIPAVIGKMISELELVPAVLGPDEAFSRIMIIHRAAVKEMCRIESSDGHSAQVFLAVEEVQSRSYGLLRRFEKFLHDSSPARKTNTLRYQIPFTKEKVEKMVHQGGDTDREFVEMLIVIETSEITLAQSYLKEGKNNYLRSLANEIIMTNRKEIEKLSLLKANNQI